MWKLIKLLAERFNNFLLYLGIAIGAIGGLLSGLGIGVIIGMLIAPRSGKEIRSDLKKKACDTIDSVKDLAGRSNHPPHQAGRDNGDGAS